MTAVATKPGTAKLATPIRIFSPDWVEDEDGREFFGPKQIAKLAENWKTLSGGWDANGRRNELRVQSAFIPDLGIGHEPDQAVLKALMKRTDLPSTGELGPVWADGDYLMSGVSGMPVELARQIDNGSLTSWSVEIYRDFVDDAGKHWGPVLRRLAFLGAEQPKRKDLGPMPKVVFMSERGRHFTRRSRLYGGPNTLICFSEARTVNREQMIAALQQAGMDVTTLTDAVPDPVLAEMVRLAKDKPEPVVKSEIPKNDEMKDKPLTPANFSELARPLIEAAVAPFKAKVESLEGDLTKEREAAKKQKVSTFCERHASKESGRITPAELQDRIAEGVALLEKPDLYAKWEKSINERQPLAKFSETFSQPAKGGTSTNKYASFSEMTPDAAKARKEELLRKIRS